MKNFKFLFTKVFLILSLVVVSLSNAQESCVPNSLDGPCPDPCNRMCCEYDPDNDTCIPINSDKNYLIILGICMIGAVWFITYKSQKKIAILE